MKTFRSFATHLTRATTREAARAATSRHARHLFDTCVPKR
jgi:hypothetical protein